LSSEPFRSDPDTVHGLELNRGVNVLVFKVVNEEGVLEKQRAFDEQE
jgi:hypothetical protein